MQEWIESYGVWAVLIGGCFEGELVNLLGGIGARAGVLPWPWVILAGWFGTFAATQVWFLAGKYAGDWVLERRPHYQAKVERAKGVMDRHGIWVFVFYRFLYGLRTITPFAIGMSGVSTAKFMIIDGAVWLVWLGALSTMGYLMGDVALGYLDVIYAYQKWFVGVFVLLVAGIWLFRRFRAKRAVLQEGEKG
jgi:membrane protein DedA with SNARE-associated domain